MDNLPHDPELQGNAIGLVPLFQRWGLSCQYRRMIVAALLLADSTILFEKSKSEQIFWAKRDNNACVPPWESKGT
jgi:hypothetical protein